MTTLEYYHYLKITVNIVSFGYHGHGRFLFIFKRIIIFFQTINYWLGVERYHIGLKLRWVEGCAVWIVHD